MYDLLGGGFHRYSVDDRWLVPHFEKMLYDNALLAAAYLHGWLVTGTDRYREIAAETIEYMLRELLLPEGGFASAQDADTDGVEGLTFTWTEEEGRAGRAARAVRARPLDHPRRARRGHACAAARDPRAAPEAAARRQGDRVVERACARGARGGRAAARAAGLDRGGAPARRLPPRPALGSGRPAAAQLPRRPHERGRAISTTTRTSRTGCSSCTSRRASCAGCARRTGSRGSRSSSSPTRSTAASSSRPPTASSWSRGRRSSTTIRFRPATRCSRTCCSGSRGSTATTSSSASARLRAPPAPARARAGAVVVRLGARRARPASEPAAASSRSSGRSAPTSPARRSSRGSRGRSWRSVRPTTCRCWRARTWSAGACGLRLRAFCVPRADHRPGPASDTRVSGRLTS